jgi:arylsulfatase A-like enzyme
MTSVVVICLDSVRKDYFNRYATNIRRMSDFSMSDCRAASTWSVPSHASFLTGSLPSEHGVHTHNMDFSTVKRNDVLTGRLDNHHTTYVSANQFTTPEFGFNSWFDSGHPISPGKYFFEGIDANNSNSIGNHIHRTFHSDNVVKSFLNGVLLKSKEITEKRSIPALLDDGCKSISKSALDIATNQKRNLFMFVNMMEAHLPHQLFQGMDREQFDLPATWSSQMIDHWKYNKSKENELEKFSEDLGRFREFYAAAIDYLDRHVSTLIEQLEDTLNDDVVTIVMADHGENLGGKQDRYLMEHTGSLTEALLQVPFEVINSPINIDDPQAMFSLRELPSLVTAIINEEDYVLGKHPVAGEVIGEGLPLASKESDYWNRAIRCTYDDNFKFEWDTFGNQYRIAIGVDGPSTEAIIDEGIPIDDRLTSRFGDNLQIYKNYVMGEDAMPSGDISEGTKSRLHELGYL